MLPIITIPDPILKQIAAPVSPDIPETRLLVENMIATLRHHARCVGIAAPQVGVSSRIVVMDVSVHQKPVPNHGLVILINPVIRQRSGRRTGREGCLSIPDFTGNVTRAETVSVEAIDPEGKTIHLDAEGFEAVVLQHEIDHLNGILFLDRVSSLATDVFRRKK